MSTTTIAGLHRVPEVIRRYFARDADRAIDAIVGLFTDDAVVVDEAQTRRGRNEIRAWQHGPASMYTYATEVLGTERRAPDHYVVTGRLTGDFPGATADLTWDFTLAGDQISKLVIAP